MKKRERIARARNAGRVSSERKAEAARANGQRGGRPENEKILKFMAANNCSRSTAYRKLRGLK